jgi:hypothetical protein
MRLPSARLLVLAQAVVRSAQAGVALRPVGLQLHRLSRETQPTASARACAQSREDTPPRRRRTAPSWASRSARARLLRILERRVKLRQRSLAAHAARQQRRSVQPRWRRRQPQLPEGPGRETRACAAERLLYSTWLLPSSAMASAK